MRQNSPNRQRNAPTTRFHGCHGTAFGSAKAKTATAKR